MRQTLQLHPDSRCDAVRRIDVEVARAGPERLTLHYVVTGAAGDLTLPLPAAPDRTDGLWRRTCFEAFLRPGVGEPYYEFNFAPSTQWAAYWFSAYRQGMQPAMGIAPPRIALRRRADGLEVDVALVLDRAPGLPRAAPWRLGLSAVIEEANGRISHWALAHPPGDPDFHHADAFALQLPGTETS